LTGQSWCRRKDRILNAKSVLEKMLLKKLLRHIISTGSVIKDKGKAMPLPVRSQQPVTKEAVLSKAVVNVAERLGLSQAKLAMTLGLSKASVSRLFAGSYQLSPEKKEWEFAVLLVRLFRSLDAIVGGAAADALRWMNSENSALAGKKPIELISSTEGLVRVTYYLDARRGIV